LSETLEPHRSPRAAFGSGGPRRGPGEIPQGHAGHAWAGTRTGV